MSSFRVQVVAINPEEEAQMTQSIETIVDTGAELSSLPRNLLHGTGVKSGKKRIMVTAAVERVELEVGYAILRTKGFEAIDEVIMGEKSDFVLSGERPIEGFGLVVDNIGHRFINRAFLAF
ncbi:MAG: hypothetical protein M1339_04945 [Bacteroidetes bacterium]|nr:hypothetical protein [Bacteroidota bacterium]